MNELSSQSVVLNRRSDDTHVTMDQWRSALPFENAVSSLSISHILISRVDALGDVILTLPLLGLLKAEHPNLKISFLARRYAQAILEACDHVDTFIEWDWLSQLPVSEAAHQVQGFGIDAVLHVFPNQKVAQVCQRAGISYRFGTSHRWFHWLWCTHRVPLGRSTSPYHEAQLNVQLAKHVGLLPSLSAMPTLDILARQYGLEVAPYVPECALVQKGAMPNSLTAPPDTEKSAGIGQPLRVILHPGSRGSARDWPVSYFEVLAKKLLAAGIQVYLTGTEAEGEQFRAYFSDVFALGLIDVSGQLNLSQLLGFIAHCDALVAASTGPLHIAAALGKRAIGIYPPARPMHAGRWGPVGSQAQAISQPKADCRSCAKGQGCVCVASILPADVSQQLVSQIVS